MLSAAEDKVMVMDCELGLFRSLEPLDELEAPSYGRLPVRVCFGGIALAEQTILNKFLDRPVFHADEEWGPVRYAVIFERETGSPLIWLRAGTFMRKGDSLALHTVKSE
jgi:hypothetical protein